MKKLAIALVGFAAATALQANEQGTMIPQNDAQRTYKRCPDAAMQRGLDAVKSICGTVRERPVFPGYEVAWDGGFSRADLSRGEQQVEAYNTFVSEFQTCINTQVMANGTLPTSTLDLAACADQYVVDQLLKSKEEWGLTCLGYNDNPNEGTNYSKQCFEGM